jgi:hypothetical protein
LLHWMSSINAYHLLLEEYGNNSKEREQSLAQVCPIFMYALTFIL